MPELAEALSVTAVPYVYVEFSAEKLMVCAWLPDAPTPVPTKVTVPAPPGLLVALLAKARLAAAACGIVGNQLTSIWQACPGVSVVLAEQFVPPLGWTVKSAGFGSGVGAVGVKEKLEKLSVPEPVLVTVKLTWLSVPRSGVPKSTAEVVDRSRTLSSRTSTVCVTRS